MIFEKFNVKRKEEDELYVMIFLNIKIAWWMRVICANNYLRIWWISTVNSDCNRLLLKWTNEMTSLVYKVEYNVTISVRLPAKQTKCHILTWVAFVGKHEREKASPADIFSETGKY
jgi:hypothetical protein